MRRFLFLFVLAAATAACVATSAMASGPLPPGKVKSGNVFPAECAGTPVTLAANQGSGAAQFVDLSGHIIPVVFQFTTVDATTAETLGVQSSPLGNGNAHPNQLTISCGGIVLFDGSASDFFGTDLPTGVSPDDEIIVTLDVTAILKQ
jgi:hypothetical protein